ncbi:hypothetical protein JB92DRAFT_3021489 [Gautieria morchelliformis]|nr:hypothetical protein JB92DRAFT_3021489 [Gautieria morchelliformis]
MTHPPPIAIVVTACLLHARGGWGWCGGGPAGSPPYRAASLAPYRGWKFSGLSALPTAVSLGNRPYPARNRTHFFLGTPNRAPRPRPPVQIQILNLHYACLPLLSATHRIPPQIDGGLAAPTPRHASCVAHTQRRPRNHGAAASGTVNSIPDATSRSAPCRPAALRVSFRVHKRQPMFPRTSQHIRPIPRTSFPRRQRTKQQTPRPVGSLRLLHGHSSESQVPTASQAPRQGLAGCPHATGLPCQANGRRAPATRTSATAVCHASPVASLARISVSRRLSLSAPDCTSAANSPDSICTQTAFLSFPCICICIGEGPACASSLHAWASYACASFLHVRPLIVRVCY